MEPLFIFMKEHEMVAAIVAVLFLLLFSYWGAKLVWRVTMGIGVGLVIAFFMYLVVCPFLGVSNLWAVYLGVAAFISELVFGKLQIPFLFTDE
jgi:hypothetical protein